MKKKDQETSNKAVDFARSLPLQEKITESLGKIWIENEKNLTTPAWFSAIAFNCGLTAFYAALQDGNNFESDEECLESVTKVVLISISKGLNQAFETRHLAAQTWGNIKKQMENPQ